MTLKETADNLYIKLDKEEVEGKVIYYKKRQVYPVISEEGKINWFNLFTGGTWGKLFLAILFVVICLGFIYEYHSNLSECTKVMSEFNSKQNLTIEYNEYQDSLRLYHNLTFNLNTTNITNDR